MNKTEREFYEQLVNSNRNLINDGEAKKLKTFLIASGFDIRTCFVLNWTPEQSEELFEILIDRENIVTIEIDKHNDKCPAIVEKIKVKNYMFGLKKRNRIQLKLALELISDYEQK